MPVLVAGVVLVLLMAARRKVTPAGITDLGFVDTDGKAFDVSPTGDDAQLGELEPVTRSLVTALLREARAAGLDVRIVPKTGARRTPEQQAQEVAQGDSQLKDGPHIYGAGVDLMFRGPAPFASDGLFAARWQQLGRIGKAIGLVWGGDWKTLRDLGHFERRDWRTLRALA